MPENTVYRRNLLALALHNSVLAQKLSQESFDDETNSSIRFIQAKTGHTVPVIEKNGTTLPLHSTFNPEREGERIGELYLASGFLVFFGLGAGYHIQPFLSSDKVNVIVIIERSLKLFSKLLEHIDLCHIFNDHRVKVLVDATIPELRDFFLAHYLPGLFGDLATIPLLPRLTGEKEYFKEVAVCVEQTINTIADDYTVQVKFGKQWFRNTLHNLFTAEHTTFTLAPQKKIIITGAGPSLESSINKIKMQKKGRFLIATDTSLPVLLDHDIVPDCVISIDCQQISYHHFIGGFPPDIPLVLDLASPPILSQLSNRVVFFSSGHPFAQYISAHWRSFPGIDTTGGNVSHAAVSLAERLGAREIILYGLDFSYPAGKTYSRGSYLYKYFYGLQYRFDTVESLFAAFIFKNKGLLTEKIGSILRYVPRPLLTYKERLESVLHSKNISVVHERVDGLPLAVQTDFSAEKQDRNINILFTAGPAECSVKEFLLEYRNEISNLPEPKNPVINYLYGLSRAERDIWMTQFPAVAALRDYTKGAEQDGAMLLKKVKKWTTAIIDAVIT
ncbi:MAG: motility associated factor glycosyltransferase family protein [Spirochaetales bacterium]|nr:motility associated factor glycosyltransferase family protein [Spirochaetales bacterium]